MTIDRRGWIHCATLLANEPVFLPPTLGENDDDPHRPPSSSLAFILDLDSVTETTPLIPTTHGNTRMMNNDILREDTYGRPQWPSTHYYDETGRNRTGVAYCITIITIDVCVWCACELRASPYANFFLRIDRTNMRDHYSIYCVIIDDYSIEQLYC